ncbi:MAG: PEP-CTERM sorting domain-containing protein [Planctomycetes bacterium]|nr:PEP-CTERM sorting domain-containing protein [Planctomycetota bacterium]
MAATNRCLRMGLAIGLCVCAAQAARGALSVGINFVGNESVSSASMDSAETAGAETQDFWNNAKSGSGSLSTLLDSAGRMTDVSVTWRGDWGYLRVPNDPGNLRLMRGYIQNLGTDTATVTVAGLNAVFPLGYGVLVYFDGANGGAAWQADYSIGAATLRATDRAGTDFAGTFIQDTGTGGNYLRFENCQGDTFTLSAASLPGSTAAINAIQIVHTPEPATVGLMGAGLAVFRLIHHRARRR